MSPVTMPAERNEVDHPWFHLPDALPQHQNQGFEALVIGAGLAGCSVARALADKGCYVTVVDAGNKVASGASANPAVILKPHVHRQPNALSHFSIRGFETTRNRFDNLLENGADIAHQFDGVLQLIENASDYPAQSCYEILDGPSASKLAGIDIRSPALYFNRAGWLDAASYCWALLQHANISIKLNVDIVSLHYIDTCRNEQAAATWEARDKEGVCQRSQCVVIANSVDLGNFKQTNALPIEAARGQTTHVKTQAKSTVNKPITDRKYVIPTPSGLHFGATFKRGDCSTCVNKDDQLENLRSAQLITGLDSDTLIPIDNWVGVRASTPDRLPLVGAAPKLSRYSELYAELHHGRPNEQFDNAEYWPGLYLTGGLGSRGTSCAELSAQHLADLITIKRENRSAELIKTLTLLHPARFKIRELRKKNT